MNDSQTRSLRNAVSFISLSLLAVIFVGGFFVSQVRADDSTVVKVAPLPAYVRGITIINWTDSTPEASNVNPFELQFVVNGTTSNGSAIASDAPAVFDSTTQLYDGSYTSWDTAKKNDKGVSITKDGSYQVRVSDSTSKIGNYGTSDTFNIDNTAPTTGLSSDKTPNSDGWYNISKGGVPDITLTCSDPSVGNVISSGCSSIHYAWYNATSSAVVVASTTVSYTSSNNGLSTQIQAPKGDNILYYYSEDKAVDNQDAHNISTTHTQEFKVDTVAPTVTSVSSDGAFFKAGTHTITVKFDEPLATAPKIAIATNGGGTDTISATNMSGTTAPTDTWTYDYTISQPSSDGFAAITISDGADVAGNTMLPSGSSSHVFIIDTTSPAIALTSPTADTVYKGATNTTSDTNAISFTSSDTNTLTYTYSIDGISTTTPAITTDHNGAINTSAISGLTDGRHTIVVTVTDEAGNSTSSAPISFVFDNDKTLTVSNNPADHADFPTIGAAVAASDSAGLTDETISVYKGKNSEKYNEDVTLNNPFTLETHCENTSSCVYATIKGTVTIPTSGSGTTVQNISFTNPDKSTALVISGASNVTVQNNTFDNIGTGLTKGSAQAIDINGGSSSSMSEITISTNIIHNVGSADLLHGTTNGGSAKGIYIGDSTGDNTISGVTIDNNHITNITASPADWIGKLDGYGGGAGAYGILVNHATSGTGSTGVTVTNNTISNLNGLWAHAIGLEGNTPGAEVTGNTISNLTDNKRGTDAVGVMLQDNTGSGSVAIHGNHFASDIIGVGNTKNMSLSGLSTNGVTSGDITNASGNWWGSIKGPRTTAGYSYQINPHGDGAGTYGLVSYVSWCTTADCATLDISAPTATLTNKPASPTNVTATNITVGPTNDAVYYKYKLDSGTWGVETSVSTAIAASSLANGSHTLDVVARDQAGNWQSESNPTTYTWTVDTVAPTLSGVSIASNNADTTLAKAGNTITLNFTSSKAVGTPTVKIDGQTAIVVSGTGTNAWVATLGMVSTYNQGNVLFTINYTDLAGNPGTEVTATNNSSSVFYDSVAPTVTIGSNKDVHTVTAQAASVNDPTPSSQIASIAWTKISGPTGGIVTFSSPTTADTNISVNVEGTYVLQITATDNAGNTASKQMTFIWDTTNPYVLTSVPVGGAQNVSKADGSATVVFNENVQDLNATKVSLVDNSTGVSVAGTITLLGDTITIPYSGLTDGTTYRINVAPGAVKDMANNNLTTNFVSHFTTSAKPDTTAPAVPVITTNTTTVNANTYTITGTDVSDGGQRIIQLYNSTNSAGTYVLAAGDTNWSILAPLTQNTDNVFTAKATDAVGNTSAASASVTITEKAPAVAPVITNIQAVSVSPTSTTITWTTNKKATSQVDYGTSSNYGSNTVATDNTPTTSHSVTLSGLTSSTVYHFRVVSTADSKTTTSGDNTFTTTVDNSTAILAVTGIDSVKTYATNNGKFADGWQWTFHVTVPTNETYLRMKFDNFTGTNGSIPVASNLRFYSDQASVAKDSTNAITIGGADAYSADMLLIKDSKSATAGRQIDITVEMRVPTTATVGSYSTSYGIDTSATKSN